MPEPEAQGVPQVKGKSRRTIACLLAAALVVVAGWLGASRFLRRYTSPPMAYAGDSRGLKATAIVPTLDTPVPHGQNVIWCSSFQVAWNRLKDDVFKEPVLVKNAEQVAGRLNAAAQSEADLPADSCYAAAGFVRGGILKTIQDEMARRFPAVPAPEFGDVSGDPILAYAYLAANAKFTVPFFENREEFRFTGADGAETGVSSFGIRIKDDYAYWQLRRQVEVLYCSEGWDASPDEKAEYAIDPCRDSSPCQIVLARIAPRATLAETLAELEKKLAAFKAASSRELGDDGPWLNPVDALLIPNIRYRLTHHFAELEGPDKLVLNKGFEGYWVALAEQVIDFKLDRSGAELASQAKTKMMPVPHYYFFNRPFLVCMKKRDSRQPFLVMWVENAELLCKR